MAVSESVDRFNGVLSTLAIKAPCVAVAIADLTLSGEQTVNGVAVVAGDRVLVTAQTSNVDNGIYDVSSSAWSRAADFDGNRDVVRGTLVTVNATVGADYFYQVTTANDITIGTTGIDFVLANSPNVTWVLSQTEIDKGFTANDINDSFEYGDVLRWEAKLTGGAANDDDTTPFNNAIQSGYPAFCRQGTANIEGDIVQDGDTMLSLSPLVTLQRFTGSSTEPMLHMYGSKNNFDPRGATIRQNLYSHPDGIIRIGPAAGETELGTTDVACRGNQISSHFKLLGAWGVTGADGSVGLYCESIRRKSFAVTNPTYGTHIESGEIYNCDIDFVASSDFNRNKICLELYQFGTAAAILNACYGNKFDFRIETAQAIAPEAWRQAVHLGTQNYLGTESGTSGYSITAAWRNELNIYAELVGSGTSKARLLNWNEPGSSASEGRNDLFLIGQFGGGYGEDGTTEAVGLGTNNIYGPELVADWDRPWKINNHHLRKLDDGSGYILRKDSWGLLTERETGLAELGTEDFIEFDDIGTTRAGLLIKLMLVASSGSSNVMTMGEQLWGFELESTDTYKSRKIKDFLSTFGGSVPAVAVSAVASQGTAGAGTMKVRFTFTGGDAAGSNTYTVSWQVEYLHSKLEGTNFDPDADITYSP